MSLMARTSIFLSLSHREGFGLPPLEAMAHRALVVGFDGGGGKEYASPRNGLWLAEGDLAGCAAALADAVRMVHDKRREVADKLTHGRATAAAYSMENMRERLLAFWSERV
jgi:glycosyltransferase involved in cell wall biosynthesis